MTPDEFESLIRSLTALPKETEWVELKHNNADAEEIGEYASALSNSAALEGKLAGYIVWGIEDETHKILGTKFKPRTTKIKGQELENWLLTQFEPRIDLRIHEGEVDSQPLVLFEIQAASHTPVAFKGVEYVRIGSYKKKLKDHPEKERALWRLFDEVPFEKGVAAAGVSSDDVLSLIDYPRYFELMGQRLPDSRSAILDRLSSERIILHKAGDRYNISNLGAILFGKNLQMFETLARKTLRVVQYEGSSRVRTIKEQVGQKGYAVGFEGMVQYINDQLPQNEQIGQAMRREVRMYPEIAIRELVANSLIHQNFAIRGAGPMVEIFPDRMEISNPGVPLIDTLRFIDEPPRSRNETLAALMRRMAICEERGSGIDKVITAVETYQLPAPDFRVTGDSTVVVLLGPRGFAEMDKEDRIRACYQHACLWFVSGKRMTNSSLRQRLNIEDKNYPIASRIIGDTQKANLIRPHGSGSARYVPFWA